MDEFDALKTEHVIMKHRLKRFLNGKGKAESVDTITHKQCKLGRWLYTEALRKYGRRIPEFAELEKIHIEFHVFVKEILALRLSRPDADVQRQIEALEANSDKLIGLVNEIKEKIALSA